MKYERFSGARTDEPRLLLCDKDRDIAPGAIYGPVIRDIYILECCISGGGSVIINDREYPFGVGDSYVLLPGDKVAHYADPKDSRVCLWCAIDGLRLGEIFTRAGVSGVAPLLPRSVFGELCEIMEEMLAMRTDNDAGAELRRTAAVYRILGAILRDKATTDKNIWVEKAIGIMEAKYNLDMSVSDLAREVGLDRSYFSTLFKSVTGMSPHAYLSSLRVRKACVLIKERGMSVSAAAEAVGLDSQNFARVFKRVTGKSPRDY